MPILPASLRWSLPSVYALTGWIIRLTSLRMVLRRKAGNYEGLYWFLTGQLFRLRRRLENRWRSLIPAGTGNTQQYKLHQNQPPGSSPLARGTLNVLAMANLQMRFIPAGTGNTVIRQMLDPQDAVHPRWHGEHQLAHGATTHLCGSSPLARGTHSTRRVGWQYRRFIPAGTGNTRLP